MMGYYADYGVDLYLNNYEPLPIEPGSKACLVPNWRSCTIDLGAVKQWCHSQSQCGAGIRTGRVRAVDIDILDPDLCQQMSEMIQERCPGPLVRIGNAPKTLLLYRVTGDAMFLGKRTSNKYQSPDGKEHRIEVLGNGQQSVAFHKHPDTGKPYHWVGNSPLDVPADELPVLDEDAADALISLFHTTCEARGWKIVAAGGRGMDMDPTWDEEARWLVSYRRKTGLTLDEIDAVLENADMTAREAWLTAGMGTHFETDGDPVALALWQKHSWPGAYDDCARVWDSFHRTADDMAGPPATLAGLHRDLVAEKAASAETAPSEGFNVKWWGDIEKREPTRQLVQHLFAYGQSTIVSSQPNTGKSAFALDLAISIATGDPWRGGYQVEQGTVLFVAAESPETIHQRIDAETERRGLSNLPVAVVQDDINLTSDKGRKSFRDNIEAWLEQHPETNMVIVDTFRSATPGLSENDGDVVGEVVACLMGVAKHHECHVLVNHHTTKVGTTYAGSGQIGGRFDTEIMISPGEKELSDLICLDFKQQRGLPSKGWCFWYRILGQSTGQKTNFQDDETAPVVEHVSDLELAEIQQEEREKKRSQDEERDHADMRNLFQHMQEGKFRETDLSAITGLKTARCKALRTAMQGFGYVSHNGKKGAGSMWQVTEKGTQEFGDWKAEEGSEPH